MCEKAKKEYYLKKIEDCEGDQKKLFRVREELMIVAKETVLPWHNDAKVFSDQFADIFNETIAKIREQFSSTPDVDDSTTDDIPPLNEFTPVSEEELRKIMSGNSNHVCLILSHHFA